MSKSISEAFYGSHESQWLVESRKEPQSHFDRRGCVRQIRRSTSGGFRSNSNVHTTTPGRDSYERTSQAYVYTGAPATHHTYIDHRQAAPYTAMNTTVNLPIVEFMVPLCCGKCEEKVKEELESVEGVYNVVCDMHNQRVTVTSTLDPQRLLKRVKRIKKNSHFWSTGGSTYSQHYQMRSHASPARSSYALPARSSYDPVQTQHMKRKALDYYAGGENQYRITSPYGGYATGTPYMETSVNYGHLPYEDYVEYY